MKIEIGPVANIKPYENNPRLNDGAVDAVARSLREFGFRQQIVVDTEGVIVVGHTRWKAAQKICLECVPVHVATELTPEQLKAYRIPDNERHTNKKWSGGRIRSSTRRIAFTLHCSLHVRASTTVVSGHFLPNRHLICESGQLLAEAT